MSALIDAPGTLEERLKFLATWLDSEASRIRNAGDKAAAFALHCEAQGVLRALDMIVSPKPHPASKEST